jgi:hypothetical protein
MYIFKWTPGRETRSSLSEFPTLHDPRCRQWQHRYIIVIEGGTAYAGTDASYKDGHGTSASRIQNDLSNQTTGCNITQEQQEHQSAYRSELGGIIGILVLLDQLRQHYDLQIHQFIIICDCNGAGLYFQSYLLWNDMARQTITRGHYPGPWGGEVLGTEPKLDAPVGFHCQGKTQGETKVLTSNLVREGSLGPKVPVNWCVQMPYLSLWGPVGWVVVWCGLWS